MTEIKPNNVIRVPCKLENVFRYWLEFLFPFHHLTDREIDVATLYLVKRYQLSKVILDEGILNRTLMGEDVQKEVKALCEITNQHFQVIRSKLKAKKFFLDNRINPRLIPNIKEDKDNFQLLLLFDYEGSKDMQTNSTVDS